MGVHSLWNILEPSARPVRLESLSRRKLAVDASIWIYQFLKAVRTQQGQSLRASHVVGFFRRICKLLFFGIQPVFVFDGGAPLLKKEVIRRRKERRQGKRDNAEKTAQKLLAMQIQRQHESPKKKKPEEDTTEYHYMEELETGKSATPQQSVRIPGEDEYKLPQIEGFKHSKDDERLMSAEEYKDMTEQLQDELEGIDLNTIDPASAEFDALPLTTQYMVLSQLRLRSRLRMGYTKEQLEEIFPESMNFSKFQIQMVQKRNYFTQRLMNISGMSGPEAEQEVRRIASEKDRQYRIQKTEGGWALSLDDDTGMTASNPVDVDREFERERGGTAIKESEDEDDIEWEDVDLTSKEKKKKTNQSISALPLPPAADGVDQGESTIRAFTFSPQKTKMKSLKAIEEDVDSEDDAVEQVEQMQLREAIEQSKRDLMKQRELERKLIEEQEQEDEFEDVPFDFGEVTQTKPKPSTQQPPVQFVQKAARDQSIFKSPVVPEKTPEPKETPAPLVPQVQKPSAPLLNSKFQQSFISSIQAKKKEELDKRTDHDLGIVSWSEAQEMLKSDDEGGEEEDDVQIVEPEVVTDKEKPETPEEAEEREEEEKDDVPPPLDYEFYESEEEQLNEQLEKEEQEHVEFQRDLNPQLAFLDSEKLLREQQKRELRDADEVTVTMVREVQELLARFGIPYITAPMEAEAQCAELLRLGLVDGIITDDSDVFLFGGDRVYRNMFHEKHYVEFYSGKELEKQGLTRKKMIELAHLLGSDYTEGLKGVGPVNAMEILANFGDLEKFRDWFLDGQFDSKKQEKENSWEKSLRKKLVKSDVILDKSFPDKRIDSAYLAAEVDHDPTEFVWGAPDLDRLRDFLMATVGWSQERVDQVLVPLIKDLNKKKREGTQTTLNEFYDVEALQGVKRKLSSNKRMSQARAKMRKK